MCFFAYGNKSFIRSGDWKLVRIKSESGDKIELYNLSNDLQENNDVSSENSELLNNLIGKLKIWNREVKEEVKVVSE